MNYGDVSAGRTGRDGLDMQLKEQPELLIVLNKQDENPSFDVNRPFLLEKYPGSVAFSVPPAGAAMAWLTLEPVMNFVVMVKLLDEQNRLSK